MSKAEIGAGDVVIVLDGEEVTLRPTLKAVLALSRINGGILGQIQRCQTFDFDAILAVIVAGLGGVNSKDLPEKVFKTGILDLAPACIRFLDILANGGRPADIEVKKDDAPLE